MQPKEYIEVSVATYKPRFQTFMRSFESVVNNDYVFSVYVNGYDDESLEFSERVLNRFGGSNVHVTNFSVGLNFGDRAKFYPLNESNLSYKPTYLFTIDDDILYPKDYFSHMLDLCQKYNGIPVGVHAATLAHKKTPISNYFRERVVRHFSSAAKRQFVNVIGTGTMCFSPKRVPIEFDFFKTPNMADCYFALYCQQNKIPMLCVNRCINWLMQLADESPSLWETRGDGKEQTQLINSHRSWEVFTDVGS